jgi:penicillin-binding protein 1A
MNKKSRRIISTLLLIAMLGIFAFAGLIIYLNSTLPDVKSLAHVQMQEPLRVFTSDGLLMAEFGEKRRNPVPLSDIPLPLQQAVIATEDQNFYKHSGVDVIGLFRAAIKLLTTGEKAEGGSTLTMQLARNFFLSPEKTYTRKIKEILLAIKISHDLPKDKVLELYFNEVYFGKRAYGIAAAAEVYYGVPLNQLTLPQMAMLAGLPKAPSTLNPLNNPAAAMDRRDHVLYRMLETGYITQAQYDEAIKTPVTAKYHHLDIEFDSPYLAEMVRDEIVKLYGDNAYNLGLSVYTTIDSHTQRLANQAVQQGLFAYDKRHGYFGPLGFIKAGTPQEEAIAQLKAYSVPSPLYKGLIVGLTPDTATVMLPSVEKVTISLASSRWARPVISAEKRGPVPKSFLSFLKVGDVIVLEKNNTTWLLSQVPKAQAAFVALSPINGKMLALVGGFNFSDNHFNRITQAQRQPGSSFKPFLYSAFLAQGNTLATIVQDAPIAINDNDATLLWRPQNDSKTFLGPIRLRVALTQSRNLASIRILEKMGIPYAIDYISHFGFNAAAMPQSLSLALGTGEVLPIELARGMSAFANGGYLVTPYFIDKIVDQKNQVIFQAQPQVANTTADPELQAPRIIDAANAYLINSAMKSVITSGTGRGARVLNRSDVAGKTGTTQNQYDNWFVGFNTQILGLAWLGFDKPQSTFENGAKSALPIWAAFMKGALASIPVSDLQRPDDIISLRIDKTTGLPAKAGNQNAFFEIFKEGTEPK